MKKRLAIQFLLSAVCFSNAYSEIRISEIMPNNVSTIVNENYNYDGYIELYNDGGDLDIKGWSISSVKDGKEDWNVVLNRTHVIPSGYSLLFFGDKETSSSDARKIDSRFAGSVGHKLSSDESVITFSKNGKRMELAYPKQYPHLSYCEQGFMIPTPGSQNNSLATSISNRAKMPVFKGSQPGFYESKLSVEIGCETNGAEIYYTLNGDEPTPNRGMRYNGAVSIDTPTVVRARAYKDGMLFSETLTGSFILPDKYYLNSECKGLGKRLPIVSISANNEDMFGDMLGMYVEGKNGIVEGCYDKPYNFNRDWMRSANFEYILDGKVVDNQEVEIGVYGGCTRIQVAKSLKIKANKRSGKNKMQYDNFFQNRDYTKYKSLALRNGGNGYSYLPPRWRDMYIQSLADGMNLDVQAAQPVSFYLNGYFYGMMILTERANKDYVYHNYGLDEDEIDFITLDGDYICEEGTKDAYDAMINYVSKNYSKEEFYDKLDEMMDIDEYMNYQILEQFVANTDWVKNNTRLWRKHDGGKFRWIVFDTDFGLSIASSVDKDMIHFVTTESGYDSWILIKSCLMNEDFRWRFLDQYLDCLENQFSDEKIDTKLDSIWDMTNIDNCATFKHSGFLGGPGNVKTFGETVESIRTFAKQRKGYVINQLKKEFGLGNDKVTIKIRPVFPNSETPNFSFLLNKREINSNKYDTWRYSGERIKVEPIIPTGYKIREWEINNVRVTLENSYTSYSGGVLTTKAEGGEVKVSIYFEYDDNYIKPSDLYLNEVCASNVTVVDEAGAASDWIEIYNGNDRDVDLAGMVVENETKSVSCTIPSGSKETVVPAHGYKILWADKKPENGPLHLNFKMSATSAETIVLKAFYRNEVIELSKMTYAPHSNDESFGLEEDGGLATTLFGKCVDDKGGEFVTSTPLAANGSVICENTFVEEAKDNSDIKISVSEKSVVLQNVGKDNLVEVISPLGVTIVKKIADSDNMELTIPTSGIYIVRVGAECVKVVVE